MIDTDMLSFVRHTCFLSVPNTWGELVETTLPAQQSMYPHSGMALFRILFFGFVRKVVGTLHGSDVKTHCLDIAGFCDFKILKYKYSENHKSFVMSLNLP